jgi:deoxyribodipyrimidine photo-lyase
VSKPDLTIYWTRRDFRFQDNPALFSAIEHSIQSKSPLIPLFLVDPGLVSENRWNIGYPRRKYLALILSKFALKFENFNIFLTTPEDFFAQLADKYNIIVFANGDIEPYSRKRDASVSQILTQTTSKIHIYDDQLSIDKDTVSGTGTKYGVFTPFRNKVLDEFLSSKVTPTISPHSIKSSILNPDFSSTIEKISFTSQTKTSELADQVFKTIDTPWTLHINNLPTINLDEILPRPDIESLWYTDETQALEQFAQFLENKISNYRSNRDDLELDTVDGGQTSRISVALKWGLVSTRTLKNMITDKFDIQSDQGVFCYVSELIWREFYRYSLYHKPELLNEEYQLKYRNTISWKSGDEAMSWFVSWIKGETGYRVVDAAMHQIARESWMHNRSRMIVASILTKNLGIDWRWGQEYFRSILLDLDEASNNGGWQWAASVGADPKPIRIFNPYTQAENYDKNGLYQAKYLPSDYNIISPLIEHKQAREEPLIRYKLAKESGVRDY